MMTYRLSDVYSFRAAEEKHKWRDREMIEAYRQPFGTSPRDFGERILAMKFRLRGGWKRKHGRRRA